MDLPKLDEQGRVTINTLMDLMFKQIWAFAEYMNGTGGKVETWKFVDYCLYAWREEFKRMAKENGWKFKVE